MQPHDVHPGTDRPRLGFNTWNKFGCSGISADVLLQTADQFVALGLDTLGYEYVNSDDCWMGANRSAGGSGPVQSKIRVPIFSARTLNDTGQSRVTLSLRQENLRAVCEPT